MSEAGIAARVARVRFRVDRLRPGTGPAGAVHSSDASSGDDPVAPQPEHLS